MAKKGDVCSKVMSISKLSHSVAESWDPFSGQIIKNLHRTPMTATARVRIQRDISQMFSDPINGIIVCPVENDITLVYALITGLFDTPYEGGLFSFAIRFPPEYPNSPPLVRHLTTDGGKVRFNPNWYKDGKVCVSILGTWSGPGWTPAQTLSSVLISIQSLMNAKPYHNEPGFEKERHPGDSDLYNRCIEHETLRVAVCGVLEKNTLPASLQDLSKGLFVEYYEHYVNLCKDRMSLDGQTLKDPFGWNHGTYMYGNLLKRIEKLHNNITLEKSKTDDSSSSSCSKDET